MQHISGLKEPEFAGTLPGGGVEVGEDLHTAIKREISEETGCQCEIIGELGQITENRHEHDFTQERSYYMASVIGEKGELHLTDEEIAENTSVVWLPIEQALQIISEKEHDNYQRKFIQKRDSAALAEAMLWMQLHDIPGYDSFVKITPINKGWSEDKKYCVTCEDGTKRLLRISPIGRYEPRKNLHEMMKRVSALGVPMCQPLDFGTFSDGVYSFQSWIDGDDLEEVLPLLSATEQYVLGLKSGEILRKIHSIHAPETQEEWGTVFERKIDSEIQKYRDCGIQFDGDKRIINFVETNWYLLNTRPQTLQHGDYSVGNMMYASGKVYVIDFSVDYGDPWQDFESIRWSVDKSMHFATGMVNGYFDNDAPDEFWRLLKLYLAEGCFHNLVWSINTGVQTQIDTTLRQISDIRNWFDNFENLLPSWYLKDFYIQWTDGIPYKLKTPFDFSFLSKYGKVFKVFDDQDSGNICFGVNNNDKRYFIKFAGAPTDEYTGTVESAIERLRAAVSPYKDLAHPNLIHFIKAEEIGDGFAVIFEWVDGICAHPMYPTDYRKFRHLPLDTRLQIYEDILDFHAFVASQDYTAVDFYDGSIMWDISNTRTVICDIDFYNKAKVYGSGFLWGHMQSASPEERTDGAIIDEISNVYNMGETAFTLFIGRKSDRSREAWPLSDSQYAVAKKAVSGERSERQQSITQFIEEWRAAK